MNDDFVAGHQLDRYKYIHMDMDKKGPAHLIDYNECWLISGPLFTKKTQSYQHRDSHYKLETVVRPS